MATATKKSQKPVAKSAKPAPVVKPTKKPKQPVVAAIVEKPAKPVKITKPAKPEFVPPTAEEKEASDQKFYETAEQHGLATENPRTGKRLSRFIVQAHALAQCWPTKPLTIEQIAANATQRFGITITANRVQRQLIDEMRCGRVVAKGKGYVRTDQQANYWSLAENEE